MFHLQLMMEWNRNTCNEKNGTCTWYGVAIHFPYDLSTLQPLPLLPVEKDANLL